MRSELEKQVLQVEQMMLSAPWDAPFFYGDFLAQTYYYVCHSTRLLGLAISYFQVDRDALHGRFATHIREERGHERLALNDLKKLGFHINRFAEAGQTRAFYETQYYKIERQEATALLGYILLLEGVSVQVGPKIYERVRNSHGADAASFLKVHIEEDVDHVEKALGQITTLPQVQQEYIRINMNQTAEIYMAMIEGIIRRYKKVALRVAA